VKHLSAKTIRNIRFPLPSLPEQQRIVAILDEAFAGIASAVEATEKNLANARELFDSYVNDVFSRKGEGWTKRAIGECFKIKSGDFLPKKVMNMSGEYVVFGGNGPTGNHDQFNLTGNNILIGRVGAKCGNVRVVSDDIWLTDNAFYISKYLIPFHPSFLATMLTKSNLGATANQTAQPVISYKTIRVVPLSFPKNVDTQEQIANDFGLLQKTSENLEAMYRKKLDALTELKQSILQKAFQGELTNGSDKALGGAGL